MKISFLRIWLLFGFLSVVLFSPSQAAPTEGELIVFAAASLTDAMRTVADEFERQWRGRVYLNFGGSSALRLQIEKGAPCDVFLSADSLNVERLRQRDLVDPQQQKVYLTNRLVVVALAGTAETITALSELPSKMVDVLSLADPAAVPAGIYAREALTSAGIWDRVQERVVPNVDVRAALAQVERGNAQFAIVYKTDVPSAKNVKIVYEIPPGLHRPIQYVMGVVKDAPHPAAAAQFYAFLERGEIKSVFRRYGFNVP